MSHTIIWIIRGPKGGNPLTNYMASALPSLTYVMKAKRFWSLQGNLSATRSNLLIWMFQDCFKWHFCKVLHQMPEIPGLHIILVMLWIIQGMTNSGMHWNRKKSITPNSRMYGKDRPAIPGLPMTVHLNKRGSEHTKGSMLFDFPNFGSKYGSPATIVT